MAFATSPHKRIFHTSFFITLLVMGAFFVFHVPPASAAVEISDGSIIALWNFNTSTTSKCIGTYEATCNLGSNAATTTFLSNLNSAASYASFPAHTGNNPSISSSTAFTVGAWIHTTSTGSVNGLIYMDNISGQGNNFQISGGKVYCGFHGVGVSGNTTIGNDEKHAVACVWTGTQLTPFLDGASDKSPVADSGSFTNVSVQFSVKSNDFESNTFFNGALDEVFVANKDESSKFSDIYNAGSGDEICVTAGCYGIFLSDPHQYMSDATTPIGEGSTTMENTVVFGATLNSNGTSTLQLQIEVQPTSTSFTDIANVTSSFVSTGTIATATKTSIAPGAYHWQARVLENGTNTTSTWQEFGTAGNTDFIVDPADSVYFNGSSSWKWPATNLGFNLTDAFTVELWYRTDATSTMQILDTQMVNKGFAIWKDSNGINLSLNCANGTSTITLSGADGGVNRVNPDTGGLFDYWHHVAVAKANTASSSIFTLYFDTEQQTSDKCYTSTSTDSIWIPGSPFTSPHSLFKGYIDEVRIWDLARSSSEIVTYYNQEVTSTDSHLRGLWRFNGTSTDIAKNQGRIGTEGTPIFSTSTPFGHFLLNYSSVNSSSIYYNASTTYIDKVTSSVATWNGSPQRAIVVTSTVATSTADLLIRDAYNSSTLANVLGQYCNVSSTTCSLGSPTQDTIFLNVYSMSSYPNNQQNVITHEIGHALRLAHSWYGNIMNYYSTTQTQLGPQDIKDYDFCWAQHNCQ